MTRIFLALVATTAFWPAVGVVAEIDLWRVAAAEGLLIAALAAFKPLTKALDHKLDLTQGGRQ